MTRITDYTALAVAVAADVLPVVDVNDTSMSAAGTTKNITVGALLAALLGWTNVVSDLGADPTGTDDSTTALSFSGPGPYYIPAGTYRVSSGTAGVAALDWKINGLKVIGDGYKNVKIRAYGATCNYPVVAVAGEGQDIGGMQIGYNAQQADTSTYAACFQMGDDTVGDCFMSHFFDMEWFQGCYGTVINPALTASAGFFSCQFDNIRGLGWSYSAIYWDSAAGTGYSACTGSAVNNLYLGNNPSGSAQTSLSYGIDIRNFDEIVFNQLNLEHSTINDTDWFNIQQVGNFVVNSLHCEALTLAGADGNAGYFHVGSSTSLIINGMTVKYATLNGTDNNPVTRFFGSGSWVDIRGFNEDDSNAFGGASAGVHPWVNFSSETSDTMTVTDIAADYLISEDSINSSTGDVLWVGPPSATVVTAGDTSIVVGGTTAAPTIETATLDVIAADHPPAANWSNNSKKITSLANGSASSDAAAIGQLPTLSSLGAAPVASPEFTGDQPTFTTAGGLALTVQGSQASITSPVSLTTSSETVLAGLTVPSGDPVAGAIYKVTVFGYFTTDSTGGTVTINLTWGSTSLCSIALNPQTSLTDAFWQLEAIVTFVTSSTCNACLKYTHDTAVANAWSANVNLTGTASAATVTVSSSETLAIQGTNGATSHVTFVATGSVPERVW